MNAVALNAYNAFQDELKAVVEVASATEISALFDSLAERLEDFKDARIVADYEARKANGEIELVDFDAVLDDFGFTDLKK